LHKGAYGGTQFKRRGFNPFKRGNYVVGAFCFGPGSLGFLTLTQHQGLLRGLKGAKKGI